MGGPEDFEDDEDEGNADTLWSEEGSTGMDDQPRPSKKDDGLRGLIGAGAELAGGTASSAIGALLGGAFAGPPGAIAGGAVATGAALALRRVGQEISERVLGPRERVRAGAVLAIAVADIRARTDSGEALRFDGFFDPGSAGRSDADEVAESVVLKAQREPEERKIPYMGYLLSSVAFDAGVSPELAHQLTKAAERLTYRQFCILKVGMMKGEFALRPSDYRGQGTFDKDLLQILYECFDLYQYGYIGNGGSVAFGPSDIVPAGMKTQGLGAYLYNLMQLSTIADEDVRPIADRLA